MSQSVEMEPHHMDVNQELAGLFSHYPAEDEFDSGSKQTSLESPWFFEIRDIKQQTFILVNNRLVAAPQRSSLRGDAITLVPNRVLDSENQPIFMGLKNGTQILCCIKSDKGLPQLQLVTGVIMDLYKKNEESTEFTFYIRTKYGETTCRFESAAFPGWFLSTSSEPYKPPGLSQQGGSDITLFYLEKKRDSGPFLL